MKSHQIALAGCAVLFGVTVGLGQDWPQWRGPNRDGKAAGFNAPETWPQELTQKWKLAVGAGDAGPVLVGEKLFVFSRQNDEEITRCLEAATGKEMWQDKYASPEFSGPDAREHSGPRSTPVVSDGKIITLGVLGKLSCLEADSGKVAWRKDDFSGAWPRFHVAMSPLVINKMCVAHLGKPGEGAVVAYDLGTGEEKWKWAGDGPAYSSPIAAKIGGTEVIIVQTDKKMACLAAADGKLLWETPFVAQGMTYNAATPIVEGQTLIYCGQNRGTTAVKLEKNGDTLSATELWKNPENSVQFSTPVLHDGFLYGLSARSDFFCIDAKAGKTAWTTPLMPQPEGAGGGTRGGRMGRTAGYGSIIDAGKVLLAVSPASQLVVFEPNEASYKELARIKIADSPVFAFPAVAGNRIFVKDQDSVILWTVP